MTRYAIWLRGINVGGKHRLPMAALREELAALGYGDVVTYIQSGNVAATSALDAEAIQAELNDALELRFGFPVPTVAVAADELRRIRSANPWVDEENPKACHVLFFPEAIPDAIADRLRGLDVAAPDGVTVGERAVYLHTPDGLMATRTGARVTRIAAAATARNLATVDKLVALTE